VVPGPPAAVFCADSVAPGANVVGVIQDALVASVVAAEAVSANTPSAVPKSPTENTNVLGVGPELISDAEAGEPAAVAAPVAAHVVTMQESFARITGRSVLIAAGVAVTFTALIAGTVT
jgi:hypothetical protein